MDRKSPGFATYIFTSLSQQYLKRELLDKLFSLLHFEDQVWSNKSKSQMSKNYVPPVINVHRTIVSFIERKVPIDDRYKD